MTGNDIRRQFLEYFQARGHQIVRSSSLVPRDDPTLLFTNAGMVQFKRVFLGEEKRGYNRATTSQKCVRAGGKHNDLENVGYTARHHTFFEMLGNFSFGDYFKEKAVEYGWDLLTNGYGFPEDKLWVSIYLDDEEAHDIWEKQIGVPPEKILRFDEKDNFWAMGDTGPCGPCSEIHYDRGPEHGCGRPDCAVGCECDRWLEIWNLVFMQFNRDASGKMEPLPKPSIDTGMGLERVVSIIQDAPTNYDIDLMIPIMEKAESLSGKYRGDSFESDVAMKVIADHSRAAAFLIGDGVLPANEGRGYVLRRIMRRAIRYGRNIGLTRPFLHETAQVVFDIMRPAYPELSDNAAFIENVIKNEELRFTETLDHGLRLLTDSLNDLRARGDTTVPGDLIFKLYDTFGFPVDIVRDVVRDMNMSLDMDGFDENMARQREKSRSVAAFSGITEAYKTLSAAGVKPEFLGYEITSCNAEVLLVVRDGNEVPEGVAGDEIEVVTDRTPFYGESGGQVGDVGTISAGDMRMAVTDTVKDPAGLIIHRGKVLSGTVRKGDTVTLAVDRERRCGTALNHTATHLLHYALRRTLGDHVKQAGSLVAPDRLRFDFTHFSQVESETLREIETIVNERIRENVPVDIAEMDAEAAFQSGATALFEEKYGDRVRVITLDDFSKELCGGTHTSATGNIGLFRIVSETSVSAGVRRIEALTGAKALEHAQKETALLHQAAGMLKERPETLTDRIEKMVANQRALEKEIERLKAKMATMSVGEARDEYRTANGVKVLTKVVEVDRPAALRDLADKLKTRIGSGVVVLGAASEGKAMLIVAVTQDLTDRFHAGKIIKEAAAVVGGGGGGRPDMAQAGGPDPKQLDAALEKAFSVVSEMAGA